MRKVRMFLTAAIIAAGFVSGSSCSDGDPDCPTGVEMCCCDTHQEMNRYKRMCTTACTGTNMCIEAPTACGG